MTPTLDSAPHSQKACARPPHERPGTRVYGLRQPMVVLVSVGAGLGKQVVGASTGKPNTDTVVVNFRPASVKLVPASVVVMVPEAPAVRLSVSAGSWN